MIKKTLISMLAVMTLAFSAGAADYESLKDLRYGEKRTDIPADDPTQDRVLDIWYPEGEAPAKGWPVVMFIHGGGFAGGDKAMSSGLKPLFYGMLEKGYAVVSIDYCLTRKNDKSVRVSCTQQMKNGFPPSGDYHPAMQKAIQDASNDAGLALQWIAKNSRKYGLDKKRIAIMGGSAGAITCLYTAFVYPPKKPRIKAVINCWGAINDVRRIDNAKIPVLTFHGDKDALINVCYGEEIQKRLEAIGSESSKFIFMEGKGHAQYKYVGTTLIGEVTGFLDKVL